MAKIKSKRLLSILLVFMMMVQAFPLSALAEGGVRWSIPQGNATAGEVYDLLADVKAVAEDGSELTVEISDVTSIDENYVWSGTDTFITWDNAGEYQVSYNAVSAVDDTVLDTYIRTVTVEPADTVIAEVTKNTFLDNQSLGMGTRSVGTNITSYIEYSDGELTYESGDTTIEIPSGSTGISFVYWVIYTFTINFKVVGYSNLSAGDFFTFTVPAIFAGESFTLSDGAIDWADVEVGSDGTVTVTFTDAVESNNFEGGSFAFDARYMGTTQGTPVEWIFDFDGEQYTYTGTAQGSSGTTGNSHYEEENRKLDDGKTGNYYYWRSILNIDMDAWDGEITMEDTLGSYHKMAAYQGNTDNEAKKVYGFYGLTDYDGANSTSVSEYYFAITTVDWDAMRAEYNRFVEYSMDQGSPTLMYQDPWRTNEDDWVTSSYRYEEEPIESGYTYFMYATMLWWRNTAWKYLYIKPYTGGLESVQVTAGGFKIVFPEGELNNQSLLVRYCSELSSGYTPSSLYNEIKISGEDWVDKKDATFSIGASGTGTGSAGSLSIVKYDSGGNETLPGAVFNWQKGDETLDTKTTGDGGTISFDLPYDYVGSDRYAGTYTLKETTAPEGYALNAPIILEFNSDGEIISVNGTSVTSTQNTDIYDGDEKICTVVKGGLQLHVYNQEEAESKGGFTITKVDLNDDTKTLKDAEFILYYMDGGTECYYVLDENDGTVSWTANKSDATVLRTDELGEISVTDLEYNTYYLEETKPPERYELNSDPVTIIAIDAEHTAVTKTVTNTRLTVDLTVKKIDADENATLLNGAEFILYYIEDNKTYYYQNPGWTDDEDQAATLVTDAGKFQLNGLDVEKTYILKETKVPDGYDDSQEGLIVYIVVDASGSITVNEGDKASEYSSYSAENKTLTITNTQTKTDFIFRKVDAADESVELDGAEFTLYSCRSDEENHTHDTLVTDNSTNCNWTVVDEKESVDGGLVRFTGLTDGEYMLVETKAPDGYQRPLGQWKITISGGVIANPVAVGDTKPPAFKEISDDEDTNYLLGNMQKYTMPEAGVNDPYRFMMLGVFLVVSAIGMLGFICWRRKRFLQT